jgi:FkbM family methyltransferase
MQDYEQIQSIISDLKKVAKAMGRGREAVSVEGLKDVHDISVIINENLYHTQKLRFQGEYDLESEVGYDNYKKEILALAGTYEQTLQRRAGNSTDVEFWNIYEYFKYVDIDDIYSRVVQHFKSLPEGLKIEYLALPNRYTFLKHHIDITEDDYSLIAEHVELMVNYVENYKWLYEHLEDYRSKNILNGIIRYWFDFDINRLYSLIETVFPDYYDSDIFQCDENDVMVDLGAYTGDSVESYINTYGRYRRIYAYEITPTTFDILKQRLGGYDNVVLRHKGAGRKNGKMFVNNDSISAGNRLLSEGDTEVEVVTLDEDIKEPVSVIKMDVEGAEKDAILGAQSHIKNERPRLLISAYHNPEDIFEIPYLINDIRDDYKFYLRFNGRGCLWPCDYVLFAV